MQYNGWTNYATWRVNLEMFDGMSPTDVTGRALPTVSELRDALREQAEELIEQTSQPGPARDYALAFMSDVDWWQIADNMLDAHATDEDADDEHETETEGA